MPATKPKSKPNLNLAMKTRRFSLVLFKSNHKKSVSSLSDVTIYINLHTHMDGIYRITLPAVSLCRVYPLMSLRRIAKSDL